MPCSIMLARKLRGGELNCRGLDVTSGEDKLIARFFKPLATHPGALALTDDAAIFEPPAGSRTRPDADAVIGGVHFFPDDPHRTRSRARRCG